MNEVQFRLERELQFRIRGEHLTGKLFVGNLTWQEDKKRWACQWSIAHVHPEVAQLYGPDPGFVVGHGVAIVPAVLAVIYNHGNEHRRDTSIESAVPILVMWLLCATILSIIAHFKKQKRNDEVP